MTANWRSRDELVHQIVALAADRMPKRAIARTLGVSRNTVKAVLATGAAQRGVEHSALLDYPARTVRVDDCFNLARVADGKRRDRAPLDRDLLQRLSM